MDCMMEHQSTVLKNNLNKLIYLFNNDGSLLNNDGSLLNNDGSLLNNDGSLLNHGWSLLNNDGSLQEEFPTCLLGQSLKDELEDPDSTAMLEKISTLQDKIESYQEIIHRFENDNKSDKLEISRLENEMHRMSQKNDILISDQKLLENELKIYKKCENEDKIKELEKNIEKLSEENKHYGSQFIEKNEEIKNLKNCREKLNEQIGKLSEENKEYGSQFIEKNEEIKNCQEKLNNILNNKDEEISKNEEMTHGIKSLLNLKNSEEWKKEIIDMDIALSEVKNELKKINTEKYKLIGDNLQHVSNISNMNINISKFEEEIKIKENRIEEIEKKLSNTLKSCAADKKKQHEKYNELKTKYDELSRENKELLNKNEELSNIYNELFNDHQKLSKINNENEEFINELNEQLTEILKKNIDTCDEYENIKNEICKIKNENCKIKNELSVANDELSIAKSDLKSACEVRDEAISSNDNLYDKIAYLENYLKTCRSNLDDLKNNLKICQSNLDDKNLELKNSEHGNEILKEEVETRQKKINELDIQLNLAKMEIKIRDDSYAIYMREVEEHMRESYIESHPNFSNKNKALDWGSIFFIQTFA
eukprot:GHVL01025846.1.p1 GENE.GHVL01025846.1~~GHVL01025846.1.p1  ORF type:complete len:594 (-),score=199.49 GHVL01025846.1:136-1917(-)